VMVSEANNEWLIRLTSISSDGNGMNEKML